MTSHYDVIVVGLGAMGSATLYQLAKRGASVLGIDRFAPPHAMGSSHGKSRIIRQAYFEDPCYVPLVQRAYECWAQLEAESGTALFQQTGGLMIGDPSSEVITGTLRSAREHTLPHQVLTTAEIRARFPAFSPRPQDIGVFEDRAGILAPERAIAAFLGLARAPKGGRAAALHTNETMRSWRAIDGGVEVATDVGVYRADRLVLTVGAWAKQILAELSLPLTVQRNVLYWFTPLQQAEHFTPAHFPIFLQELESGIAWYGFADTGDGVKLALHQYGQTVDPDAPRTPVSADEVAFMRSLIAQHMPHANGALRDSATCFYTNTPDGHFVVDIHPECPAVVVASPCSGHGFKFASALGEVLADLASGQKPVFEIEPFSLARFAAR
jgi:sarcosine oxidase